MDRCINTLKQQFTIIVTLETIAYYMNTVIDNAWPLPTCLSGVGVGGRGVVEGVGVERSQFAPPPVHGRADHGLRSTGGSAACRGGRARRRVAGLGVPLEPQPHSRTALSATPRVKGEMPMRGRDGMFFALLVKSVLCKIVWDEDSKCFKIATEIS